MREPIEVFSVRDLRNRAIDLIRNADITTVPSRRLAGPPNLGPLQVRLSALAAVGALQVAPMEHFMRCYSIEAGGGILNLKRCQDPREEVQ